MTENAIALNDYEIIRLLGEGGTARVYLAKESRSGHTVAVKVPLDSEGKQKYDHLLKREYDLIGGLNFPGLVRVYELIENNKDIPALIIEYSRNQSLQSLKLTLDHKKAADIISSISINLYFLNMLGIYHGDLKPDNIFLARKVGDDMSSKSPLVKISDFSLGLRDGEESKSRLGLGTVGYIAPETLSEGTLNHRSDLFALGVIAYELTTGEHPFRDRDNDPVRINSKIKEYNPKAPIELNPSLPKELSDLVMSLLTKNPRQRPGNGWEVCLALENCGADFGFRRIIRPKYLINKNNNESIRDFLSEGPFDFDEESIDYIDRLCGSGRIDLRRLLESNFGRGNMIWEEGVLRIKSGKNNIHWPTRLKRDIWKQFLNYPFSRKRMAVKAAVLGDLDDALRVGIADTDRDFPITYRLVKCLRENLSPRTIRKQAAGLAEQTRNNRENLHIPAKLFIAAENTESAFHFSLEASRALASEGRHEENYRLLESLIALCRQKDDTEKLRKTLMELGDSQKRVGDATRAEESYRLIIETFSDGDEDRLLAEAYKDIGDVYKMKQNFEAGIESLQKAVNIYTKLDDQLELSHTLNNIGNILTIIAKHKEAFQQFRKALRIQRRLNSMNDAAMTLNNMAAYYFHKGRYDRIKWLFKLSLKINRQNGNLAEVARVQNNLGYTYHELGEFDKAVDSLTESQAIIRKTGIKKELLYNLNNLTEVMLSAGRLRESLGFLKEGIALADELSDRPHKAFLINNLAAVLKRMGFFGQALEKLREAQQLGNDIDDMDHPIVCRVRLADLYRIIGERDKADKVISEIFELVKERNIDRAIKKGTGELEGAAVGRRVRTQPLGLNAQRNHR